jgi:hypothetical protein
VEGAVPADGGAERLTDQNAGGLNQQKYAEMMDCLIFI